MLRHAAERGASLDFAISGNVNGRALSILKLRKGYGATLRSIAEKCLYVIYEFKGLDFIQAIPEETLLRTIDNHSYEEMCRILAFLKRIGFVFRKSLLEALFNFATEKQGRFAFVTFNLIRVNELPRECLHVLRRIHLKVAEHTLKYTLVVRKKEMIHFLLCLRRVQKDTGGGMIFGKDVERMMLDYIFSPESLVGIKI